MNIYTRRDGRLEGRVYLGKDGQGKRKYKSFYGATVEEIERKYGISRLSLEPVCKKTEMTVSELAADWLLSVQNRVKGSTLANYQMKLRKHILPAFGTKCACTLDGKDIYRFMNEKISSGLSVRYVSDILVLMKSIFRCGVREYGFKNVFDGITMPKKQLTEIRLLTKDEENRLKSYISSTPSRFTLGIALTMYTGLRIGEICALQGRDIDIISCTLTVRHTIQRVQCSDDGAKTRLMITEPKSEKSRRVIPIPECLTALLRKFRTDESCFLLTGTDRPMEPRAMQYRFSRLLKKLGLPHIHYHALRHKFSTSAIELGFDVKTLSEILGHSSVELTMRLYVHSSFERKRACMDLFRWSE